MFKLLNRFSSLHYRGQKRRCAGSPPVELQPSARQPEAIRSILTTITLAQTFLPTLIPAPTPSSLPFPFYVNTSRYSYGRYYQKSTTAGNLVPSINSYNRNYTWFICSIPLCIYCTAAAISDTGSGEKTSSFLLTIRINYSLPPSFQDIL
jgi:hypothetical protein